LEYGGGIDKVLAEFPDLAEVMPLGIAALRDLQAKHDGPLNKEDTRDILCDWIDAHVVDAES